MVEAAPAPEPATATTRRSRRVPPAAVIAAVTAVLGWSLRVWVRAGAAPLVWNDSADYLESAGAGLLSAHRLAGPRPILMPTVLAAVGRDLERLVTVQEVTAAIAWGLLAGAVASTLHGLRQQVPAALAVLALSLTWPISMWDQVVLSESTALSTFALLVAAGIWFVARPGAWRAVALVVAAALWLFARDSHLVPVALTGIVVLVAARWAAAERRRLLVLTGAYLLALSFLVAAMAQHGGRDQLPLEHVYAVRILPYPDRVAWFAGHGMPEASALDAIPEMGEPAAGQAPYTPVPPEARWSAWRSWLRTHGRTTYIRYALAHPGYVLSEPRRRPERVFNNGTGLEGYRPLQLAEVPGLAAVLFPSTTITLLVAIAAGGILAARARHATPLVWAGAVLVGTWLPHAAVVWHSDGMESARHLLLPGVQLRTGTLLLVVAAATVPRARGTARSRPARSPDHPPARHPRRA